MVGNIIIYTLSDPITNDVRYVGKTSLSIQLRYNNHIYKSRLKRTHKDCWIQSLLSNNLKPIIEVIDECSFENWILFERYWICQMKVWGFDLTNHSVGGEGASGYLFGPMKEETKQKLSNKMKGRKTHDIIFTDEIKNKISKSKFKPIQQFDLYDNLVKEYSSLIEAANSIRLTVSAISKTIKNEKYTAGGYRWKYKPI